jgi:hypothetical protein
VCAGGKNIPSLNQIIEYIEADGWLGPEFVQILRDMTTFETNLTTGMIAIVDYGDERWFRKQIHYLFKSFHAKKMVPDVTFRYPMVAPKRLTEEKISINNIFAEADKHDAIIHVDPKLRLIQARAARLIENYRRWRLLLFLILCS